MSSSPHLILIGLMGSGKSSVGALCARQLKRVFIDTDETIVTNTKTSISELFDSGEESFRELERDAVAQACATTTPAVIACGGGAVVDPMSRDLIQSSGTVAWLQADPEELERRIGDTTARPLLAGADPKQVLTKLALERDGLYEKAANFKVDTHGLTVTEVADVVIQEYTQCRA